MLLGSTPVVIAAIPQPPMSSRCFLFRVCFCGEKEMTMHVSAQDGSNGGRKFREFTPDVGFFLSNSWNIGFRHTCELEAQFSIGP